MPPVKSSKRSAGSPKGGAKRPKGGRRRAGEPAGKSADPEIELEMAVPFEEADGFQIFKAGHGSRKRAAPLPGTPAPEVPPAEVPAGSGSRPDSLVAEWMTGTIRSIVREEVRRAVERAARSAVQSAAAAGDPVMGTVRK